MSPAPRQASDLPRLSSRTIYAGRVVTLNLETVTLPNGATVELEVIHHPGAAAAVPVRDDGAVLLIRQYRHAAGGYIYDRYEKSQVRP